MCAFRFISHANVLPPIKLSFDRFYLAGKTSCLLKTADEVKCVFYFKGKNVSFFSRTDALRRAFFFLLLFSYENAREGKHSVLSEG